RRMKRRTLKPNVVPAPAWKRSVRNGMRNRAVQPRASRDTATFHIPFQSTFSLSRFESWASHIAPKGLVRNSNALRRSWKLSIRIVTLSSDEKSASRRSCVARMRPGSAYARTCTYSATPSRATLTTVRSLAGAPSTGSRCRKSVMESAVDQIGAFRPWASEIGTGEDTTVSVPLPRHLSTSLEQTRDESACAKVARGSTLDATPPTRLAVTRKRRMPYRQPTAWIAIPTAAAARMGRERRYIRNAWLLNASASPSVSPAAHQARDHRTRTALLPRARRKAAKTARPRARDAG